MQERTRLSGMDLKTYLGNLRKNPKFTEEILNLIEEDLRFGLTKEETEEYSSGKYDYRQMQVYSKCLRNGYGAEEKAVLLKEGLSGEQMAVALEFYEKGVPLAATAQVLESAEHTAYTMKRLFEQVLKKKEAAEGGIPQKDMSYAKELVEQIREVVEKIAFQEKRYDALNEKLKELQITGQDAKIQNNLLAQLSEKDGMLEQQQNELNEARVQIAKLRGELSEAGKERTRLEEQMKQMESKKEEGAGKPSENGQAENTQKAGSTEKNRKPQMAATSPVLPAFPGIEYHAAIMDKNGRVVQFVPVERMERKNMGNIMTAMFSRLCLRKRTDIVRLLAEKDLSPEQLAQVRNAIEQGLTEKQLLVLINNKIPAEQMEEIIRIAVYENKEQEG